MNDTELPMDDESRVERLLDQFDDDGLIKGADGEATEAVAEQKPADETPVEQTGDSAPPEAASAEEPEAKPEPEQPAIEPPSTWKADLKERWKALPVDLQRDLAQWETERNSGFNQRLEEANRTKREADAAKLAAEQRLSETAQTQQRYAQQLGAYVQAFEQFDPVLTEYRSTDLVKLARENPARYAELEAMYRQRVQVIQLAQAEQQRTQAQAMQAHFAREEQALVSRIPEFSDPTKAKQELDGLRSHVVSKYGFRPDEVQTIADHRYVLLARDAMLAQTYKAELEALKAKQATQAQATQAAIQAKRAPAPVQKVMRPEPSQDAGKSKTAVERNKAILKQASKVKGLSAKAELLAQLVDEI